MRSRGEDPPEYRGVDNRLASLGQCRGLPYIGDLGRQRGWCVDFRSSRPPSPPHKLLRTYDTIQYSTGQVIHDIDIRNPIIRWSSANSTYGTASGRRKGQPIRNHRLERVRLGWKRVKHKMCTCAWWRGGRERERGQRWRGGGAPSRAYWHMYALRIPSVVFGPVMCGVREEKHTILPAFAGTQT